MQKIYIRTLTIFFLVLLLNIPKAYCSPNHFYNAQTDTLQSWENHNFSDVSAFNPRHFRFIYQTVTGWAWPVISKETNTFRVLADPNYIQSNPKISCSVIDQNHREIFRKGIGLILNVPTSNILYTSPEDAGSPMDGLTFSNLYEKISDFIHISSRTLYTPDELLSETGRTYIKYNEIGVSGTEPTYGDKVQVSAIVITAKSLGCNGSYEGLINNWQNEKIERKLRRCGINSDVTQMIIVLKDRYPTLLLNL